MLSAHSHHALITNSTTESPPRPLPHSRSHLPSAFPIHTTNLPHQNHKQASIVHPIILFCLANLFVAIHTRSPSPKITAWPPLPVHRIHLLHIRCQPLSYTTHEETLPRLRLVRSWRLPPSYRRRLPLLLPRRSLAWHRPNRSLGARCRAVCKRMDYMAYNGYADRR